MLLGYIRCTDSADSCVAGEEQELPFLQPESLRSSRWDQVPLGTACSGVGKGSVGPPSANLHHGEAERLQLGLFLPCLLPVQQILVTDTADASRHTLVSFCW